MLLCGGPGCGSRTVGADEECPGPDMLSAPIDGLSAEHSEGTCSFEVEQGGRVHLIFCDGQSCRWYVDEEMICTCLQLDYSMRCANGVPLCADWLSSFDFSSP